MAKRDTADSFQQSHHSHPRGKNYLLAIAINAYQQCTPLHNAVRDVEAFIELMTSRYHFEEQQVIFLKDEQATKPAIEQAFDGLIDLITPEDNLIVYFSGHGRYHQRRGGYWLPVEAGAGDGDWTKYFDNERVRYYLSRIESFHTFLIADSCFSGTLFIDKSKEKSVEERRDSEPSRWGLTSGKREIVSDGEPGQHSPFASALLKTLRDTDKPLGVVNLCDKVLEIVAANEQQTPMFSPLKVEGHKYGQMVFYLRDNEEADWAAALASNSRKAYSDFCLKYPISQYSDQALEKLEFLEEKDAWYKVRKNREADLLRYLRDNPHSPYRDEALQLIEHLQLESTDSPAQQIAQKTIFADPPLILPQTQNPLPDQMVLVKGGSFEREEKRKKHVVMLNDFYISKYQLTFKEYAAFCTATQRALPNDRGWGRDQRPVINVSWYDAVAYCNWRSKQEKRTKVYTIDGQNVSADWQANGYRLPSEAEWEFAARGRNKSKGFEYAASNTIDKVAWYGTNSDGKTQPVGQKKANELGLYDLSGNVWEWCWDWFDAYPVTTSQNNPRGPAQGHYRVLRGGSWGSNPRHCRVSFRHVGDPEVALDGRGFRLVISSWQ